MRGGKPRRPAMSGGDDWNDDGDAEQHWNEGEDEGGKKQDDAEWSTPLPHR